MKMIPLNPSGFAKVDDEDYERLSQWKWQNIKGYAVRMVSQGGRKVSVFMHKEVMGAGSGALVDHKDGDQSNDQKYNLRFATHQQNSANCKPHCDNKTGYKGVTRKALSQKWEARIFVSGKQIYLGLHPTPEEAARAYDLAAAAYFGDFARLNFPDA